MHPYRALVVEDTPVHATLAELNLQEVGFAVTLASSLRDGWRWAAENLALAPGVPAGPPTLALLDMKLPDPRHPRLEGSALATWLSSEMAAGRIQPGHIVGISSELTPAREWAALAAGCTTVLAKPLTPLKARLLRDLLAEPLPAISDDVAVAAFRQGQLDVLDLLDQAYQAPARLWSAAEMRALLGIMTASLHLDRAEREQGERLLAELGGPTATRIRLRAALPQLSPEQGRVLTLLLQNVTQQHIAGRLGIGRRKLEAQIDQVLDEVAVIFSS